MSSFFPGKPANQYNDEFNTEEEIREMSEDVGGVIVFFDTLNYNQKAIDQFFTRVRGESRILGVYYLSQSQFEVTKGTIGNNSNIIFLFKPILKDKEKLHRDNAGFDLRYDDL